MSSPSRRTSISSGGWPGPPPSNEGFISNAGFVVTDEGVVVLDALGSPSLATRMRELVRTVTDRPVAKVVVSHYHADHIYGLQVYKDEGAQVVARGEALAYLSGPQAAARLAERRETLKPFIDERTARDCSGPGACSSRTSTTTSARRAIARQCGRSHPISPWTGSIATVFSRGLAGLALGVTLLCLTLGIWPGVIAGLIHAILYVMVLAPMINALGHWRGAQTFANTAYNSRLLAWVTGGEGLHNNHHAHPRAPKFSMRRFEFDPSWVVIRCLAWIRLVEIIGTPVSVSGEHRAS